ncbi:protein arginine kinase [Mangrovibacillus cuniculi]|uniref:Protein-arginine kinase n=1 Tax=Mangrovibacillus cuniculi TaxID=2593652 RepID=A0A7S8HGK6_9BACI|nr:protein arginine kinase [Mangrovibacillus cuniculi]QPC48008.1 protein arginine kinase [Mangrovibacillus cuniculi]
MIPETMLQTGRSPWMDWNGPENDIVLSSRIRLARNLEDIEFPTTHSLEEGKHVLKKIYDAWKEEQQTINVPSYWTLMSELSSLKRAVLVEKHLISPLLASHEENGAVLISEKENVSVLVNEEDHIRIQSLLPGLQLKEAFQTATEVDDLLEKSLTYSYHDSFGYLTSCPTNVGTGLRASVLIHLPGLVLTNRINRLITAVSQLGLVVRGIYGEGSEALGNMFQISNQTTLGKSEEELIEHLESVVHQIIQQERLARETLVKQSNIQLEDRVHRSFGTLKYARIIESKEASQCLSDIQLGIDLGYIKGLQRPLLTELMIQSQPAFLQLGAGETLSASQRDVRRANLIRSRLKEELKEE